MQDPGPEWFCWALGACPVELTPTNPGALYAILHFRFLWKNRRIWKHRARFLSATAGETGRFPPWPLSPESSSVPCLVVTAARCGACDDSLCPLQQLLLSLPWGIPESEGTSKFRGPESHTRRRISGSFIACAVPILALKTRVVGRGLRGQCSRGVLGWHMWPRGPSGQLWVCLAGRGPGARSPASRPPRWKEGLAASGPSVSAVPLARLHGRSLARGVTAGSTFANCARPGRVRSVDHGSLVCEIPAYLPGRPRGSNRTTPWENPAWRLVHQKHFPPSSIFQVWCVSPGVLAAEKLTASELWAHASW